MSWTGSSSVSRSPSSLCFFSGGAYSVFGVYIQNLTGLQYRLFRELNTVDQLDTEGSHRIFREPTA
jgi:hypothetical protein